MTYKPGVKRLDIKYGNRWAATVNGRHVGRARHPGMAMKIAQQKAKEYEDA